MHLRYIVILAILTMSLSVKAQFHITPQVGYTFSSIIQKNTDNTYYKFAQDYDKIKPAFGVMASKNLGKKLSLQTDLIYSQKGAHVVESDIICTYMDGINSKHLDIGIQLAYKISNEITLESGMFHSHLLNATEIEYGFSGRFEYNVQESYNNETGASLGLSYTLYNITARAKYSFGIWGTSEAEKHHWFLLTLGYRFEV